MKKFNLLTIAALSMTIGLLGGCGGKGNGDDPVTPPDPEIPDVFEEASYQDYMAALEGKSRNDAPYKKCLINGTVKEYGESEVLASFADEPVRFTDGMSRPLPRPQYSKNVNTYAMSIVMSFATYWSSDEEGIVLYLNKGNKETPYMVKAQELVAEGVWATTSYVYNEYGVAVSAKSVVNSAPTDPLVFNAVDYKEIKDLTFTWLEKDMIDSYENIGYTAFHAKAQEFEAADCEYQSGHASGTVGYCNSETIVTLENDVLVPGSERFESVSHFSELVEVFHNRASNTPNYDSYYFYYSETLDSLMAIMNMASDSAVVERVKVWNNNGLPTSVKDTKYGNCEIYGSMRIYDVALSYSKDAATVTLTVLPGLGTWSDGSTSKTITVNVGSYLGTAMAGFDFPTCEGMTRRESYLARQDGRLIEYGVKLVDDLTLIVPFYESGSPTILTFTEPSSVQIDVIGYTSTTPIMVYTTDGSNDGFYFQSGTKQTISYTFKDTKALGSTKSLYVYGANVRFGDSDGPFIKSNCSLSSLTLSGQSSVLDYAFAYTCVESVSFQGSTLSSIGSHAFAHCEYLTNFYCGNIANIGEYAFADSGLSGVFYSARNAETVGENAFDECEDLYGVIVNYTIVEYKETYQWNRFIKNNQVAPDGWDENWAGDAHIVYGLTVDSFLHDENNVPVTGTVGGPNGEDTISFAYYYPYSETETYSSYVAAYANNKIAVMNQDLSLIYETTASEYQKTVDGLEGGQYIIFEVYGEASTNSNEYLINIQ